MVYSKDRLLYPMKRVDFDPNGDLLAGCPLVSPTAWNLTYQWPVHTIGPECVPDEPPEQPTHLVVYRDRVDEVHFLQINAVTQRMLGGCPAVAATTAWTPASFSHANVTAPCAS